MDGKPHIGIIIVAGGSGRRMGGSLPKQFLLLDGRPVLARTIDRMAEALPGGEIVVVLPAEHIAFWENYACRFGVAPHRTTAGGTERFASVRQGLEALPASCTHIVVHDGVRPLASKRMILRVVLEAMEHGAAVPVVAPADSYRTVEERDGVPYSRPVDRTALRIVQTPQAFEAGLLRRAYAQPYDVRFTDDATAVEAAGGAIRLTEGERTNLKITTPGDLALAEALLRMEDGTESL